MAVEIKDIIEVTETTSLQDFRNKIAELREEISKLKLAGEDYSKEAQQISVLQGHIGEVMNASKKNVDAQKGSMNELLATLRQQKEEWKALGNVEQADIDRKAKLTAEINKTKAAINEMNHSIGNYQDNVGNYSNSIVDAFSKMGISFGGTTSKMMGMFGTMEGGLSGLTKSFKNLWATLLANPIGVVIAAIGGLVAAFSTLSNAIHDNEQLELRMHEAMAAFRPLKDGFKRWLDELAEGFVAFSEKVAQAYNWVRELIAAYTDWLGLTEGRTQEVKEEIENYSMLAKAENDYLKANREVRKSNSRDEARIAQLRDEAMYAKDAAEKETKLREARELQEKVNKRNINLAEADLALKKANAMLTPNSTKVENELADAEVRVNNERARGANALRGLDRQLKGYGNTAGSAKKSIDELADSERELAAALRETERAASDAENAVLDGLQKALDLQQAEIDKRKTAMELEMEDYEQKKALLEEYHLSTEELEQNHEERMAELRAEVEQAEYEELLRQRNAEKAIDEQRTKEYEKLMKARQTATQNMASGTVGIMKQVSRAMGESTKLGKGFAIAAATIDTIASAVTGFRAGMNQWADAGPMAWMAPVQAALNATMALTAGFAEVQKIKSVDTSGNSAGGSTGGAVALAIPNIEGLSSPVDYTRQVTTETEKEEMNQNNRVYILESDIQQSNNRVKVREEETTF